MKLFDDFEAVRFPEENLIFITHSEYIYYIYDPTYKNWRKHIRTGQDKITIKNYQEVSKEEIMDAMNGTFPKKETDFIKLCATSQLCVMDMMRLFQEDYAQYMADYTVYYSVDKFLSMSNLHTKSFLALKSMFDDALALQQSKEEVLTKIKELYSNFYGRDIFKEEIKIIDGHDCSSYFWIMPVRVVDYTDTSDLDNVAEMKNAEISIEEDDVNQYLMPFLYKHFDNELKANKNRVDICWTKSDGVHTKYIDGFAWYLTHNFYTHDSVMNIIKDLEDTIGALSSGKENEFTVKLREKRGTETYKLLYAKDMSSEQVKEYNDNRPTVDNTEPEMIIDFYHRLIYRLEYMIKIGQEKGYDLISVMGP